MSARLRRDPRRDPMVITGLFHIAIKTANLAATVKFYTEVI
ncbi:MAG: VOC family protein, partial [Alphaproteobacteria bacterium]|nr:VOC family protein [Alphaproteobacteria bacterium]